MRAWRCSVFAVVTAACGAGATLAGPVGTAADATLPSDWAAAADPGARDLATQGGDVEAPEGVTASSAGDLEPGDAGAQRPGEDGSADAGVGPDALPPDAAGGLDAVDPDAATPDAPAPDAAAPDAGPSCNPPSTVEIGGACVPSCGVAGGNTCAVAGSTLCDGIALVASYDCAVCCARPAYPGPRPASFHIVVIADQDRWDAIWALEQAHPTTGPMITSENKAPLVPHDLWARKFGINGGAYDGTTLADAMHAAFVPFDSAPRMVAIDELNSGTIGIVSACVDRMQAVYPQWAGRWGVFLVHGNNVAYSGLQPALDKLLQAGAPIVVELYPKRSDYCAAGKTAGLRDAWLADFYRGNQGTFPNDRFVWLMKRRAALGSSSPVTVAFGVTDTYMNGANPAIFLDRMFYVWVTQSGYPSVLGLGNGGPGAWKWAASAVSTSGRDQAFANSYAHYVVAGQKTSLLGQVPCP